MREIAAILFDDFETLDVFGPVEILGRLKDHFNPQFYSMSGGLITSSQNVPVLTKNIAEIGGENFILFIPGGIGVRALVKDENFIVNLKQLSERAEYILTVCTGSILFSKTGLLNGKRATSNKRLFAWTKDGNIYTSSGVSAGIDMTLGFVSDLLGYDTAKQQSNEIEYEWNEDPDRDPFSNLYL